VEIELKPEGVVRVLDRGSGIPEADRDLVFRRFWRRDRSRSGGAGLGLSIVWRIVQAHGGKVWVEDRPGGGAAFVIKLKPMQPPPGKSAAAPATPERPVEEPMPEPGE
jgi:signal transduction histidine kinase